VGGFTPRSEAQLAGELQHKVGQLPLGRRQGLQVLAHPLQKGFGRWWSHRMAAGRWACS